MATLEVFDLFEWYSERVPSPATQAELDALEAEAKRQIMAHINDGDAVLMLDGTLAQIYFKIPKYDNSSAVMLPVVAVGADGSGSGEETH